MKKIHILPTDKPSRLFYLASNLHLEEGQLISPKNYQHLYITSDEEIKKGDWYVNTFDKRIGKNNIINHSYHKKIILTTDQDLIKDDVRAINDTFLEWFVKNPSCEEVEVDSWSDDLDGYWLKKYKIIIPSEEPQQETLEEAADVYSKRSNASVFQENHKRDFINGAKWQQERILKNANKIYNVDRTI